MRKVLLTLMLVGFSACRTGGADPNDASPQGAYLVVRNQFFYDVTMYAITNGGLATRIGTVVGNSTSRFPVREWLRASSDLQFVASPIGVNRGATTGFVHAAPGDTVTFTISPTMVGNSVMIRSMSP